MEQKLAGQDQKRAVKKDTQQYKIQEIWRNLPKTDFNKATDELVKMQLKGKLYTKLSEIYEIQAGEKVKRSTIRRCVNSLIKQAK